MSNLQVIKSKSDLELLVKDKNALARLHDDKVEDFKTNFIELWNNQYLIKNAVPSELLEFCIQVTNIGLSVNPWHKELYILPFTQKGKDGKKLEAVYRKEAIEQMAFRAGIQIESDSIWNIVGDGILYSNMTYSEQSKIKANDIKYINDNFIGFEIRFYDLKSNLRPQKFTITYDYLKYATNDNNIEKDSDQVAKLLHKAYRKAFSLAFIPKGRDTRDLLSKLDNINYNEDIETVETKETSTEEIQNALKPSSENVVKDVTIEDINILYANSESDIQIKMHAVFNSNAGWKTNYTPQQLNVLKSELEEIK